MPNEVENALIVASEDSDKDVRSCVAYALGNSSGSNTVMSTLEKLSNDEDPAVSSYADLGLDILEGRRAKEMTIKETE